MRIRSTAMGTRLPTTSSNGTGCTAPELLASLESASQGRVSASLPGPEGGIMTALFLSLRKLFLGFLSL